VAVIVSASGCCNCCHRRCPPPPSGTGRMERRGRTRAGRSHYSCVSKTLPLLRRSHRGSAAENASVVAGIGGPVPLSMSSSSSSSSQRMSCSVAVVVRRTIDVTPSSPPASNENGFRTSSTMRAVPCRAVPCRAVPCRAEAAGMDETMSLESYRRWVR
jgi:hypothetical protein